ncbi:DUF2232 domain-containing protein [Desulfitobacterium chlororespirans]|uniref:Predicted membrane protein n=1 Tax=Desulfitobacterium chlororespirans DSM 11544 TaxID=1121395 RepID=A0A1M7TFI5_9FIRM|nr:DUF2232 domain-containing protein [Desulfitobacterium chlororespirans]SHN69467.1 Predicted membrane protein [Desulfitobacterium chlororespirans DSM 11544]
MYVSDQKTTNTLAVLVLVIGPWLGVSMQVWGWMLDILLLIALLWVGRSVGRQRLRYGLVFLISGYGLALLFNGVSSLHYFSFVPWAALVTLWGMGANVPQRALVFWSLVAAGILGVLPTLAMLMQGIPQESIQSFVQNMMEQYRQAGMLESLKTQGISELELQSLFEQIVNTLIMLTPGLVAITALAKWGAVYYTFLRWMPIPGREYRPFTEWRLPWYAIWGMNFAIVSYLLGDQFQWLAMKSIGINLMLVYGVVAFVLGSALFVTLLRKPWLSGFFRFVLLFSSFLYIQVTAIVLIIMGLLDLVLDFRHMPIRKKEDSD